ncbi:MAG: DsrE/DsrF/DrsH-like family protein, partial [Chloroflexota bacterium]
YVQTYGVEARDRMATPIYLAAAAAAMDMEVAIYFTVHGPTMLRRGVPETVRVQRAEGDGALIGHFIDQARELGVRFLVCQPSLDLNGMTMDDVIDGVEMIGGAAFNALAVEADAVISF